jgi:hypothetical protein
VEGSTEKALDGRLVSNEYTALGTKYSLVAKRGNWEMRDEIEIERGATARKSFAFVNAHLDITSEPAGADIAVDGKLRGRTPLPLELPLPAPGHRQL